MDYEFTYDDHGHPSLSLDMGQETTANWLNSEIGTDIVKLQQLLDIIDELKAGTREKYEVKNRRFQLVLNRDEADISELHNGINEQTTEDGLDYAEEGLTIYEDESISGCGLDDLEDLLLAWQDFIS